MRSLTIVVVEEAHLATDYAKPLGRPLVDTLITEAFAGHVDLFPWDMGLAFPAPIAKHWR